MFGVGPYSFAPFKVAISGLHKAPAFRAVRPRDGRPVMLDDTCYFLPCSSAAEAAALSALCNDPIALAFLGSASFPEAKRPITKALLQRLDLGAILERADRGGSGTAPPRRWPMSWGSTPPPVGSTASRSRSWRSIATRVPGRRSRRPDPARTPG